MLEGEEEGRPRGCDHVIMAAGSNSVPERGRFHLNSFGSIKLSVDGKTAWSEDKAVCGAFSKEPILIGQKFAVNVFEQILANIFCVRFKCNKCNIQ